MTEIDNIQRSHFQDLSPWIDTMILALDTFNCIQFSMPAPLITFLEQTLVNHGEKLEFSHVCIDSAGNASCSLDFTEWDCRRELQSYLIQEKIPHTLYVNNDEDQWIKVEYRYINGIFKRLYIDYFIEFLSIMEVKQFLDDGAGKQLLEKIIVQEALSNPCPFWEEDLNTIKPLVLKSIAIGN